MLPEPTADILEGLSVVYRIPASPFSRTQAGSQSPLLVDVVTWLNSVQETQEEGLGSFQTEGLPLFAVPSHRWGRKKCSGRKWKKISKRWRKARFNLRAPGVSSRMKGNKNKKKFWLKSLLWHLETPKRERTS